MTVRSFFGGVLVVIGALIVGVFGACIVFAGWNALFEPSDAAVFIPWYAMLIPFAFGLLVFLVGIWLRSGRPPESPD